MATPLSATARERPRSAACFGTALVRRPSDREISDLESTQPFRRDRLASRLFWTENSGPSCARSTAAIVTSRFKASHWNKRKNRALPQRWSLLFQQSRIKSCPALLH